MNFTIDVCFTPAQAEHRTISNNTVIVVVDILRATTSMVSALAHGARSVIPVSSIEKAMTLQKNGFPVAAERDGVLLSFANFGNSAFAFQKGEVKNKKLVFTTTNGTVAIDTACRHSQKVVVGAFSNISALALWVAQQQREVLVLCAGWKNTFCLEDTLFAGAFIDKLLELKAYEIASDSAHAAIDLWNTAKSDVMQYIQKAAHRERLRVLGVDDVLEFSFQQDSTAVVPIMRDGELVDVNQAL
ncbi:MAG: 2-phosphosulfolactate phosphatase [Clostridia bacterium]|nr:2-phosphosulfolactate phosphatase [Clostridia bacterium]